MQPPKTLEVDVLESADIVVYDQSRKPRQSDSEESFSTSYSPDIGFGHRVRFRDVAGAAAKYSRPMDDRASSDEGHFDRIPRTATQGFDMNVLVVTRTETRVIVQWQDSTETEENSTSLVPYNNVDDQDVWPGEVVSLQAEEQVFQQVDKSVLVCQKLGVVQSVNAAARTAKVRWYDDSTTATIPLVTKARKEPQQNSENCLMDTAKSRCMISSRTQLLRKGVEIWSSSRLILCHQ